MRKERRCSGARGRSEEEGAKVGGGGQVGRRIVVARG